MPLFIGVGERIRARLIAKGYQQPNGKPDVRRFCRERAYDTTLFYFWLRDLNTPMKDRARLAADLGISEVELLHGAVPKAQPGKARRYGKAKAVVLALGVGLAALLSPNRTAGSGETPSAGDWGLRPPSYRKSRSGMVFA